ncbi:hypothetical protein L1887_16530 [Cichorium endivia]|nr:hypothetical protein L1887_16530 [Cichorium endivia]
MDRVSVNKDLDLISCSSFGFGKLLVYRENLKKLKADSSEEVRKILFRFRNKELHRICGTEDARILNIQTASRATIGILSDTASRLHRHLYLELLGTANEVKIADPHYRCNHRAYIPKAFMPMNICYHAISISISISNMKIQSLIQVLMRAFEKYPFHSYGLIDAPKILADIVESTIKAIYVDSNSYYMGAEWAVIGGGESGVGKYSGAVEQ